MDSELLAALARQEKLLAQILKALNKPKLGFGGDSQTNYIYCNRHNNCLWYQINKSDNNEIVPLAFKSFTGYLRELKFEQKTRRDKPVYKLLSKFEADNSQYIFESGYDSQFSKGILAVVATLSYEQLKMPMTIEPRPGKESEVLFCSIFVEGQLMLIEQGNLTNEHWREIARKAIHNVRAANSEPF